MYFKRYFFLNTEIKVKNNCNILSSFFQIIILPLKNGNLVNSQFPNKMGFFWNLCINILFVQFFLQ